MTPATTLLRHSRVDRVPWAIVEDEFIEAWGWPNGQEFDPEHMTVYGKSGGGKTYFVRYILKRRAELRKSHVTAVVTKGSDKVVSGWGWPIIEKWPPEKYGQNQVIFWARAKGISVEHRRPQRAKVKALMDALWRGGSNMVIYWDELIYLEQSLGLKVELENFYREGRSHGITNVASMQRPSGVTRLAHSEAGWTIAFPPKDQDDRKRVAEVLGNRTFYSAVLEDLDRSKHEFLMVHDLTGARLISHLPRPRRPAVPSQQKGAR